MGRSPESFFGQREVGHRGGVGCEVLGLGQDQGFSALPLLMLGLDSSQSLVVGGGGGGVVLGIVAYLM